MQSGRIGRLALSAMAALSIPVAAGAAERVVAIATRPGVTLDIVVVEPPARPAAAVILLPGGSGRIGLWRDPARRTNNFLVRARGLFATKGLLTVVVDAPSDRHQGLRNWRDSSDHRADIAAVVKWVKAKAPVPVWLIGTSRGTTSVAYLAPYLAIDGAVLTSSITEQTHRIPITVLTAPLDRIGMPVLVVAHRQDECAVTPPRRAADIRAALTASPRAEVMMFDGGDAPRSGPCKALSQHGYIGIEAKVVNAIAGWIEAPGAPLGGN